MRKSPDLPANSFGNEAKIGHVFGRPPTPDSAAVVPFLSSVADPRQPIMAFSEESLVRLARLSRLDLPPATLAELGGEMSSILALIDRLQAVDTSGATPLAHPLWVDAAIETAMGQRAPRSDTADKGINREANLQNAPQTENGLFLVPKVIE